MADFVSFVLDLLHIQDFMLQIGLMIATAMILGVVLDPDWKNFWKWAVTGVVFVSFQAWMRVTLIEKGQHDIVALNTWLSFTMSVLFGLGMALGVIIVKAAKKPYKPYIEELEKRLSEITNRQDDDNEIR